MTRKKSIFYYLDKHFDNLDVENLRKEMAFQYEVFFSVEAFKMYFVNDFLKIFDNTNKSDDCRCEFCEYNDTCQKYLDNNSNLNNVLYDQHKKCFEPNVIPTLQLNREIMTKYRFDVDLDEYNKLINQLLKNYSKEPRVQDVLNKYIDDKSLKHNAEVCGLAKSTFTDLYYESAQIKFDNLINVIISLEISNSDADFLFKRMGYFCPNLVFTTKRIATTLIRMSIIKLLLDSNVRDYNFINHILALNNLKKIVRPNDNK